MVRQAFTNTLKHDASLTSRSGSVTDWLTFSMTVGTDPSEVCVCLFLSPDSHAIQKLLDSPCIYSLVGAPSVLGLPLLKLWCKVHVCNVLGGCWLSTPLQACCDRHSVTSRPWSADHTSNICGNRTTALLAAKQVLLVGCLCDFEQCGLSTAVDFARAA